MGIIKIVGQTVMPVLSACNSIAAKALGAGEDRVKLLQRRNRYFQDLIRFSSDYIQMTYNVLDKNLDRDELTRNFSKVTSIYNYDLGKLQLDEKVGQTVKSYLHLLMDLYHSVRGTAAYACREKLEQCDTLREKVLRTISADDILFKV